MSADDWDGWREGLKAKRAAQLAESDTTGFKQCTPWHFQRYVCGQLLNWWPSSRRWQWNGKVYYGDNRALQGFIRNREKDRTGE